MENLPVSVLYMLVDKDKFMQHRHISVEGMKKYVFRDVENLLNTRRQISFVPDAYGEVNNSLFVYGIRDFTSRNPKSDLLRQELRSDIEKTILQFEPRLQNLSVLLEESKQSEHDIIFRINALMVVEPEIEQVTFDTVLDINTGEYTVS
ncbi:MAG: type VI secretion system baseplate subunit TssE [Planctomycetota bacterium]|jgi:type VI secretion system protein ImpF